MKTLNALITTEQNKICLEEILNGMPGLSHFKAGVLLESCLVTLNKQNHQSGLSISLSGDHPQNMLLEWSSEMTEQIKNTYCDQQEATEHAAECIAIIICQKLWGYTVLERSVKGTGIDYWLGNESDSLLFQNKARLEVSGILDGDESIIEGRFKQKWNQSKISDSSLLPAVISITSFKQPHNKCAKRNDCI